MNDNCHPKHDGDCLDNYHTVGRNSRCALSLFYEPPRPAKRKSCGNSDDTRDIGTIYESIRYREDHME